MTKLKSELDKITPGELIRYVVSAEECDAACAVVEKFKGHPAASHLLRDYYLGLHEADDEMAVDIRVVEEKSGSFLFSLGSETETSNKFFGAVKIYLPWPSKNIDQGLPGKAFQRGNFNHSVQSQEGDCAISCR